MKAYLMVLFCCLAFVAGCRSDQEKENIEPEASQPARTSVVFQGCRTCHPQVRHDRNHDFPCIDCHKGDEEGRDKPSAHTGLIAQPAHPDFMAETCGRCHEDKIQNCADSLHFTMRNKISLVREHFGIQDGEANLTEISPSLEPGTKAELVDDMLLRRCLRCHVYYSGDTYASTQRGTGCAACHMGFSNGKLLSHELIGAPGDFQCLSCHYANFVGADYYGRYEHDLGSEYRTPFITREEFFRPYGVEYHELAPDIHQQQGLSCVDCHNGHEKIQDSITCRTCHQIAASEQERKDLPSNIRFENGLPLLTARLTGKSHGIPRMIHPAHEKYGDRVACQVCHAQWSFNDTTTHLLRSDTDDYDMWGKLVVQSSSTIENYLEHNLYSDEEELPPVMPDTVTGKSITGVWYKAFTERRWERMIIQPDNDGRIKVFRPILDLRLSYVDSDDNVVFDNLQGSGKGLLPYTPHTTGKAGLFYLTRFAHLINQTNSTDTPE